MEYRTRCMYIRYRFKPQTMSQLTKRIKSNSYLKVSNCTDLADIEAAMDDLRELDKEFGSDNQTLLNLWAKFIEKKKKLQAKETKSNLHPIFANALTPFMP